MRNFRLSLVVTAVCLLMGSTGPVGAYIDDNSRYELERTRNALLDKRDQLTKMYQRLLRDSDDLNRQLNSVQYKIKYTYDDMKRTDATLADVEYSLKSTH